ncbi:MAG: aminodeoxychorismate synthase component I [Chitinivibrionales bacterium]
MTGKKFFRLTKAELKRIIPVSGHFVFLESSKPSIDNRFSYLFTSPVKILETWEYSKAGEVLRDTEHASGKKWISGFISYEAGYALEPRLKKLQPPPSAPLVWFGVFDDPYIYDHLKGKWNSEPKENQNPSNPDNKTDLKPGISFQEYKDSVYRIKDYISQGETYQVNYTFNNTLFCDTDPVSLYTSLRLNQPTPYSGILNYGNGYVISLSPELFYHRDRLSITAKPMKGTAKRKPGIKDDKSLKEELSEDPKNKAENLMIVDLLRNDIGRIAQQGSVRVPKLFSVETHPTLHQMTSTVTGRLTKGVTFDERIKALFPCGSVTGAPKIRTMEIIRELEKGERGIYCGALGFISPSGTEKFSVPIRTLHKKASEQTWDFRLGSGIVWDSSASAEWKECLLKGDFVRDNTPEFSVIESLLLKNGHFKYPREHAERMKNSAEYFSIPFSKRRLFRLFKEIRKEISISIKPMKIRIILEKNGRLSYTYSCISDTPVIRTVSLSEKSVDKSNTFLYHKTTHRKWYRGTAEKIQKNLLYDEIYTNQDRELTEGSRTNLFIQKSGTLYTPPISSGLLPGVLREVLLRKRICQEMLLYPDDLANADRIYCGNSVRGLVEVKFKE